MTEQEKQKKVESLRAELKQLLATPKSDWHAAFEALLRIETYRFGDLVQIHTEEEIGINPPRVDFVILVENEKVDFGKSIYEDFRKFNIIEYKNPHDVLDERVIRKAVGYANFFIGVSSRASDRPADQVTISIFRAKKPGALFRKMIKKNQLVEGNVPGIYHVQGITDLHFQIVITDELQGDEYAAYRALTDQASQEDVQQVIIDIRKKDEAVLAEYYRTLVDLISQKNPDVIAKVKEEKSMVGDTILEIFDDQVQEKIRQAVAPMAQKLQESEKEAAESKKEAAESKKEAKRAAEYSTELARRIEYLERLLKNNNIDISSDLPQPGLAEDSVKYEAS